MKNKRLRVKKSLLPKAGKGLFTKVDFSKGDVVCEYEGERITWAEAIKRNDRDLGGYVFYITKKNCVDALPLVKTFGRYANDAAGLSRVKGLRNNSVYEVRKNRVYIVATRKIKAGAEVFVSYGRQYWKVMKEEIENREKEKKKKARARKKEKAARKKKPDAGNKGSGKGKDGQAKVKSKKELRKQAA